MPNSIVLVVPCYNEAKRLDVKAFTGFLQAHSEVRMVFVDDGSKDNTLAVLGRLAAEFPEVVFVTSMPQNGGKAAAVRHGMQFALELPGAEIIGYWDADLATPLDAAPEMAKEFDRGPQIAVVMGARVRLLGRDIRRKALRHYLGRIFATAVSTMLDLPIYDSQCGAKLFRVNPELRSMLEQPFLSRWIFDVEILYRLMVRDPQGSRGLEQRLVEYPLASWRDVDGSKVKSNDFFKAALELFTIHRFYYRQRPRS
ncbi:Glycosyltransferase involved in cell wall bisynthesis [Bryocella elongata]|uniref:Glycosyltransferase involved in cell wall bisynthesis n=1 Tax=Bryocella elongata TaxID=863522 RepID=A0A1H5SQ56_9BACT|nr:glycosyltransferase [Bryocella elongata]SEF52762.1 Glycosyltransferase involved in cell wall bisynthesis [Bryocella elongata]